MESRPTGVFRAPGWSESAQRKHTSFNSRHSECSFRRTLRDTIFASSDLYHCVPGIGRLTGKSEMPKSPGLAIAFNL